MVTNVLGGTDSARRFCERTDIYAHPLIPPPPAWALQSDPSALAGEGEQRQSYGSGRLCRPDP
jgi:hypothetical protein